MARIRSIHPGLFTDEAFMELTVECPLAAPLLMGLWCEADDNGAFAWKPLTLKARCLPATDLRIEPLLERLVQGRFVKRFEIAGSAIGVVRNFGKFQRPKKPKAIHAVSEEMRAYAGFGAADAPEDSSEAEDDGGSEPVPNRYGTGSELCPQREEGGGKREEIDSPPPPPAEARAPDRSEGKGFAELTGARVVAFPVRDPFEAEARLLAAGLDLAGAADFQALGPLLSSGGAGRADVLAAIEDARRAGERAPRSWSGLGGWAVQRARGRERLALRDERAASRLGARAPPEIGGEAAALFEAVWRGFPRDKTASRPKAEAAFAALSAADQAQFAGSISAISAHIRAQKLSSPHDLARFIAERRFEGFANAAPTGPPQVKVSRFSKAGEAWEAYRRATAGKGVPWEAGRGFWYFPSEWPPAAAAKEA